MNDARTIQMTKGQRDEETYEDDVGLRCPVRTLLSKLVGVLEEIRALLFSLRTHSPWLTVKEAERYIHARHGELMRAIDAGELPSFRRTPRSPALVHARHIDTWIMKCWITVPGEDERGTRP